MKNWILKRVGGNYIEMGSALSVDPVLVRIMANRGVRSLDECRQFLCPSKDAFHDPSLLKDSEKACGIIREFIENEKHIRIIGDYDVDGVMSTFILYSALENLGAIVSYAIPHRVEDGYGMSVGLVESAHEDGVDLIVTCDNGIAALGAINQAMDYGITVVVTDHHQVPFMMLGEKKVQTLPLAAAVVNPSRDDDEYPLKGICGAVVAYKLMELLYKTMGKPVSFVEGFLQFAAFATVCDVMPLLGENRSIVSFGLRQMEQTENVGLKALIERQGLSGKTITAHHLGYVLGPCINASGRLSEATKALELLLCKDALKAARIAEELVALNTLRKDLTKAGDEAAAEIIENEGYENDKVMVVRVPELHESLCGIVAGHIIRTYYRPVIVLCDVGDRVKGSARSIPKYNLFEELSNIKEIPLAFGGHSQAAGMSLAADDVDEFRRLLNEKSRLTDEDITEVIKIDVDMPISYMTINFVEQLSLLEPLGAENREPLFAQLNVPIRSIKYMGKDNQYLKMYLDAGNGNQIECVNFSSPERFKLAFDAKNGQGTFDSYINGDSSAGAKLDIVYKAAINEFRGVKTLQVVLEDYR